MRVVFIYLTILLIVIAGGLQAQQAKVLSKQHLFSDTVFARFSMCGTIREDTVMFNVPGSQTGLLRYFERNLRYPLDDDSMMVVPCTLYFVIDKGGRVTEAWCPAGPPEPVVREVIRVAKKTGVFIPGHIKGKPVITRVEMHILFVDLAEAETNIHKYDDYGTDIVIRKGPVCRLPAAKKQ